MDFQEKQRRTFFFMAKNLGEAECFEDMVDAMKILAELNVDLTEDERNLLDVGYKNVIKKRWKSWKILSSLERQGEENGNELHVMRIMKYKNKVVTLELDRICDEVLAVIHEHLIPSATSRESLVSYCTIIGNIFRDLTHTELQADMNVAANQILRAYQRASSIIADGDLPPRHPIRLGLALNFSVFYYEIMHLPESACHIAKQALDETISDLDTLGEEEPFNVCTLIMQLLKDNSRKWMD